MAQPIWITPAGNLGTIGEGEFFQQTITAEDPDGGTVSYQLLAGTLPIGIQVKTNGIIEGTPVPTSIVQGIPTEVADDTTSTFAVRAVSADGQLNDRTFSLTVTGADAPEFVTPAGTIGTFFDGTQATVTVEATDVDPGETLTYSVIFGSLPPGLELNPTTGVISGIILPLELPPSSAETGYDASQFDQYPFDLSVRTFNKNFQFTLKVSDGNLSSLREFEIFVYSTVAMTSDDTQDTSDDTFITSDVTPLYVPIITTPTGNLGTYRADNFFVYQFETINYNNKPVEVYLNGGSLPPGLTLSSTGFLYGEFPDIGSVEATYNFALRVKQIDELFIPYDPLQAYDTDAVVSYQTNNYQALEPVSAGVLPTNTAYWYRLDSPVSADYDYSISFIGNIDTTVTWLTGTLVSGTTDLYSLGTIDNGAVSLLKVEATTTLDTVLNYRLKEGSYPDTPGVYNKLPQGLKLLESGNIAGRVSFNGFALDGGTTTFDEDRSTRLEVEPTTFDSKFTFTVEVYSADGLVSTFRTFTIQVIRAFNTPYERLYIQAMPPLSDRDIIANLVQNQDIFDPGFIYRQDDPRFGVSRKVTYTHAFSLDTGTLDEYVTALELNHFRKPLVLGEINTAKALNSDGTVEYEVVYADIVDTGVNKQGESPPQSVNVAYPFTDQDGSTEISKVYPNSLINMRDQVVDTIGQNSVVLPLWMTSKQDDGRILGFTKAWVIAYCKPGFSDQVKYYVERDFGTQLNKIDFIVDRYILDRELTKNWIPNSDSTDGGSWYPHPALFTTFNVDQDVNPTVSDDPTTFDQGSIRFTKPVDKYEYTDEYNKYLVFPKTNILG